MIAFWIYVIFGFLFMACDIEFKYYDEEREPGNIRIFLRFIFIPIKLLFELVDLALYSIDMLVTFIRRRK